MYKKIVIPLDGSPLSEVALPYAEEIAGKIGSEIILLTVLQSEESQEYENHHTYTKRIVDITKRQVEKYLEKTGDSSARVGTATRSGDPAEGILDYVNRGTSDLIVMATHGRSGISRWTMGSVADKVARSTTRQPMLLIRAKGSHPDVRAKRILRKALIPLDGSIGSEAVIPFIMGIAPKLQMELTLLQVLSKNNHADALAESYLDGICNRLIRDGVKTRYQVKAGSAADQIIDLADEMAIDMVAMSTRSKTGMNLWPLGSVAQKVLLGGNTPLMLIKV